MATVWRPARRQSRTGRTPRSPDPLYVYVKAQSLERPEVQEFVRFYLNQAPELAAEVGYVASPEETYTKDKARFEADVAGEGTPDSAAAATPAA